MTQDSPTSSGTPPRALASDFLRWTRPLAALAVVAMLLARAVLPALLGSAVGLGSVIRVLQEVSNLVSVLAALCAAILAVLEVLLLQRQRAGMVLQIAAVAVTGCVLMLGLVGVVTRVPATGKAVIGVASAALAVLVAWDAMRVPFARMAGAALGAVGVGALLRLGAVALVPLTREAVSAGATPPLLGPGVPRLVATLAFALEVIALLFTFAWLGARSKKLTSPVTITVLVVAFLITSQALVAPTEGEGLTLITLRRAVEQLLTRPQPFGPRAALAFVAVVAPIAALAALLVRSPVPALGAVIALAMVARGATEMPMGALAMVLAAATLALASRDQRGLWAGLTKEAAAREPDTA